MLLNGPGGWEGTPAFVVPVPPQQIYINGNAYNLNSSTSQAGQSYYQDSFVYVDPVSQLQAGISRYFNGGTPNGSIWGYAGGGYFQGEYAPDSATVSGISSQFVVAFGVFSGNPRVGPPYISWNGTRLHFSYYDSNGTDYYEDDSELCMVQISSDYEVTGSGPYFLTGNYNPTNSQFNIPGNFFAQDSLGNPIGLPVGVTLLFGSNASGQAIMGGNGSVIGPTFSYTTPGGAFGLKYVGLSDGPLLVQDANQSYTSPVYSFQSAQGDTVINGLASNGWPQTNLYPPHLYVSGVLCTLQTSSENDSGGPPPGRYGQATYQMSGNQVTVVLSWEWDSQFQGSVNVSLATGGAWSGSWDGLSGFGGMPSYVSITTTPSSGNPVTGPAQISLNGVPYNYLPSASGIFNSQYADIYQSASGAQIVINNNGTVTLTRKDGSQVSGTYNSSTQQFDFNGQDVGTISANNNLGQTLNTVISGGQTTEITGSLDVQGNVLTLGSWANGSDSVNALTLGYTDTTGGQPGLLNFNTTRASVNWRWSSAQSDGSSTQVPSMVLDANHQLQLYGTSGGTNPTIVLDPAGINTGFHGPVRLQPQGDISMGSFTNGPTPP